MKFKPTHAITLGVLAAWALTASFAQEAKERNPLEGIWKWTFTMPDGGEVAPQIKFSVKDNALTGTTKFRPGSETPLANIVLQGDQVGFDVVRERDGERAVTHYSGTLNGNVINGKITTKANGTEQSYDWEAKRSSSIEGLWKWTTMMRDRPIESKIALKLEGERLTGKLSGLRGFDFDIHQGLFKGDNVSFETERPGRDGEKSTNHYYGTFSGDRIIGKIETTSAGTKRTNDWVAMRSE